MVALWKRGSSMAISKPRVKLPKTARAGEVFTVKTLINHVMENGERVDQNGNSIPRQIINRFVCQFNKTTVFECDIHPSVSQNPFFEFTARVSEAGVFSFEWHDDDGSVYRLERHIELV